MQLINGTLVFSASDLTGYVACGHLLQLELRAIAGEVVRPDRLDPELDVLTERGLEHEQWFLDHLRTEGKKVVEIPSRFEGDTASSSLVFACEVTLAAIKSGADAIYQAAFFDGTWLGYADFLLRVDKPSALGAFSYEVADTKLARHTKPAALLQTCAYSEQLERLQGVAPEHISVVLGDRIARTYRYQDFAAYFRSVKRRFEAAIAEGRIASYPEPVEHCGVCRWFDRCDDQRRVDDHLSIVAGLGRDQARKLVSVGIGSALALGTTTVEHVPKIGDAVLEKLKRQARLQLSQRASGLVTYELLPTAGPDRGLARLPVPSPGDLFFDMEGDPYVDGGLQYLFGVAWRDAGRECFRAFWAHDRAGEKAAFEAFMDFAVERRRAFPDMHIYHYASYEETALKTLMGIHATREDAVDDLLREEILVDLYRVVVQGLAVSQESYSIKKLEALYMGTRHSAIKDAGSSIVAYEEWLKKRDQLILDGIEAYNREDCISTLRLRDWLELRRDEAIARFGALALPRPAPRPIPVEDDGEEEQGEVEQLVRSLSADVPTDSALRTSVQQATWILAHLLGWHRREAKAEWWAYFARCDMTPEELFEDSYALSGLKPTDASPVVVKQSLLYEYAFDPTQEHRIGLNDAPDDPATQRPAGTVAYIDDIAGVIRLRRSKRNEARHPQNLMPAGPLNTIAMRESLLRLGRWVSAHGIDGDGPYRAARDLLLSLPPRVPGGAEALVRHGETTQEAATRLALQLDGACLAIQGPPGSGKTTTAAKIALTLIAAGRRVGVTANSHKVISNLLREICHEARLQRRPILAYQRIDDEADACREPEVHFAKSPRDVEAACRVPGVDVVAGTPWLFAREGMVGALDTLLVDEAGQVSLANAIAIAPSARNVVLLGDPNQLAQPSTGAHPDGAGVSALEHILAGNATIPANRGLFLERTFRMHPNVCRYVSAAFYEDRLGADAMCMNQSVGGDGLLGGNGLRFAPVEHVGNRTASDEEAAKVRAIIYALVGRTWTDQHGSVRTLSLDDVIVVAPYNAHVEALARALPVGARVGTVDKFQGQQAAVAIYSMATSSPNDMPRRMDFLYSRNRLNVAVSRAFALSIVVCSPALLQVTCKTPEQMRLANALCLFQEQATVLA
jgi:uncharacterized protein